uniref:F-box domain-containing protein n=1 Tax=Bionectria ochroleuca TaxID=29856 RepID=A0A8H7NES4_BIOOC
MPSTPLLDVPLEVLRAILSRCILSLYYDRRYDGRVGYFLQEPNYGEMFRLRSACRAFNHVFRDALIQTQVLNHLAPLPEHPPYNKIQPLSYWQTRTDDGAQKLWHSYIAHMVQKGVNPSVRYLPNAPEISWCAEIREISQLICDRFPHSDLSDTIEALCWLGFGGEMGGLGHLWYINSHVAQLPVELQGEFRRNINLLSAAAYLNHLPLARELLAEHADPTLNDFLFPAPIEAAARGGNIEMLQLFQEVLPEPEPEPEPKQKHPLEIIGGFPEYLDEDVPELPLHSTMGSVPCTGKADPRAVVGAAATGNLQVLEAALYPPSRSDINNSDYFGQPYGRVNPYSRPGRALKSIMVHSKTWQVYSRLASFFHDFYISQPAEAAFHLQMFAEFGSYKMVKNLLERGVAWQGSNRRYAPPMHAAARHGRGDIVDLLIQHGADINQPGRSLFKSPLYQAVKGRSIKIVQKLLDMGAVCEFNTLQLALFCGDPEMGELVLARFPLKNLLYEHIWQLLARAEEGNCTFVNKLLREKIPGLRDLDRATALTSKQWSDMVKQASKGVPKTRKWWFS